MRFISSVVAVAIAWSCCPLAVAAEGHTLTVESGDVSGFYYPEAGALCRLINRERSRHGLRCVVEPTLGSLANLTALRVGDGQLAIVQSRILAQAVTGGEGPAREPDAGLRILMSLHGEALAVLVNPAAKIKSMTDVKGKRLAVGHPGSFQRLMADSLLASEGLTSRDLGQVLEMDAHEASEALCRNEIDAAVFTGLHPLAEVQDAIDECGASLLSVRSSAVDTYLKANPAFIRQTIPGDTYAGVHDKVVSFGIASLLVTTASLSPDDAYEVVKAVFEGLAFLKSQHPLFGGLDRKQMARDAMVAPLHEGALRYYKENGLQ
ncbi:TAXI family TRAP transporter solute-binding subunit [Telmatospirillum siberiense]|nr:TAXI family TRAP transporter solute-binding subunit [Telmatospirillum siberiense]